MGATRKLLTVSTSLNSGGAERFISTLLTHLDRRLFEPALCLLRDDVAYPLPADVPLTVLHWEHWWNRSKSLRRFAQLIDHVRPDIVLSNIHATNIFTGWALRRTVHRPVWVARIGSDPTREGKLREFFAGRVYPHVDRFVVNTPGLIDPLVRSYPSAADRIDVIGNPADFDAIDRAAQESPAHQRPDDKPLLIALGRLFQVKRYDVMLETFALLKRQHDARLWICGDGPCRESLVAQIQRLGLSESVRLLGHCGNPFALLRQADIFLLSSDYEGLPNALIEAQGLGLPAVTTRCPFGPEEIVDDGHTGLLVPVGNAAAMARAISDLLRDPQRRQAMSSAARTRVRERFAAAAVTRAWEALLINSLDAAGGRRRFNHASGV